MRGIRSWSARPGRRSHGRRAVLGGLSALAGLVALGGLAPAPVLADAVPLAMCGNPGPAPGPVQHVILVMLENHSYSQVVGSPGAPYQTSLAAKCGSATAMFGATHSSAANYLAVSAGEYPPSRPAGCGKVAACADPSDNLYHQLNAAGLTWRGYMESMPSPCTASSGGSYKIGHNPILFYTDLTSAQCQASDLPVDSLTAESGPFWNDLQNQTLPAFSLVTPNLSDDADQGGLPAADTWLQGFLGLVTASPSYQAGNTLVLITYDEGSGPDYTVGEDCANMSLDLPITDGVSAQQDSCHIPLLVVYPFTWAGASDGTFFDLYSITRTVEDLFGLPHLAHAGDPQTASLAGHFGIPDDRAAPGPGPAHASLGRRLAPSLPARPAGN
jgi:phosphatidylinositol-3-phosphatase